MRAVFAIPTNMDSGETSPCNPRSRADDLPVTADIQRHTRQAHALERAQDYAEAIAELIAETGEARVTDLAKRLGISHVTAGRTVQRLQRDGLVTTQPYRSIFLTDAGRKVAEESRERHKIVVDFLKSLGIPDATALSDAEGIEHHVSEETLSAFRRHLQRGLEPVA
jgi:DtxR family manganese transport transcriptional regulator